MRVRSYEVRDAESIANLFCVSVHVLAAPYYDQAQRNAWAPRPPDVPAWRLRLLVLNTLVASAVDQPAGFLSYEDDGHIDLLYVAPQHARCGVGSMLMTAVERAMPAVGLFTEASLVARPFFLRHGFHVVAEQVVLHRGIEFVRYKMCRAARLPDGQ